jgi:acyl-CoA synthetase (AMP-forming)/AMP-acid ligase II
MFHCFGLVLGLLAVLTHGAKIVYPAELFDPAGTLQAISNEGCTALHGVPAMFDSLFSLPRSGLDFSKLRTGIIAGSPVPRHLMELMVKEFGMTEFTSSYGTFSFLSMLMIRDIYLIKSRFDRSIANLLQCIHPRHG